jgi:hypothetical protein
MTQSDLYQRQVCTSINLSDVLPKCWVNASLPTAWNKCYFTTGSLPPISSSWRRVPWDPRPEIFFQLNSCGNSPYVTSSLTRRWGTCIRPITFFVLQEV